MMDSHSNQNIASMEDVFNGNMGLMQDLHSSCNIKIICDHATENALSNTHKDINKKAAIAVSSIITNATTTISSSTIVNDTRDGIIADIAQCKTTVASEIRKSTVDTHMEKNRIIALLNRLRIDTTTHATEERD